MGQEHPIIDGNVHTVPLDGPKHIESKDCWCEPKLCANFSGDGGVIHYVHREMQ